MAHDHRLKVFNVKNPEDKLLDEARLLVLSSKPVDVRVVLEKPPRPLITFSEHEPPQGPRSPMESLRLLGNPSIPRPLEKAYYEGLQHLHSFFQVQL